MSGFFFDHRVTPHGRSGLAGGGVDLRETHDRARSLGYSFSGYGRSTAGPFTFRLTQGNVSHIATAASFGAVRDAVESLFDEVAPSELAEQLRASLEAYR